MDPPIFCVNNCGFFGSEATNNLCSKCYKDFLLRRTKAAVAVQLSKTMKTMQVGASNQEHGGTANAAADDGNIKQTPNRCRLCRKRVGLIGIKCRCGDTFCSVHRLWDKHGCSFDYKKVERDAIAQENPAIKADKLEKI